MTTTTIFVIVFEPYWSGARTLVRRDIVHRHSRMELGGETMLERDFQPDVIKELKVRLPGCIILKNDSSYKQGIPDLIVLWEDRWATLECKKSRKSVHRPNQDYYVELMNQMSFSSFLYPENKQEVLDDLERFFKEL